MKKPIYIVLLILILLIVAYLVTANLPKLKFAEKNTSATSTNDSLDNVVSDTSNDWLLVPNLRAGNVHRGASEAKLREIFSPSNIKKTIIYLGEGEEENGLVIFPDDPTRKMEIFLSSNGLAKAVSIMGEKSEWKFESGVTLGMTLKQLEALNGGPFTFLGWGWDNGGIIMDWQGGNLESLPIGQKAWIQLFPKVQAEIENDSSLNGDREHNSSDPVLQKLNPIITHITVQISD